MVCFINNNGMDFNTTIDIIIKDLRDIGQIVDDFKNYPDVPALQIELAKSKCRYAEEIISLLKKHNPDYTAEKPVEKDLPKSLEGKTGRSSESIPRASIKGDSGPAPDPRSEKNEKAEAAKKKENISAVIKSIPLNELSRAIRMNDRFLFIREIFGGNSIAYEEAINKLDRAESLSDAKAIIMSYTGESEETEVVSQLLEIVRRKLPSDG
jgi:hypothetical protein